MATAGPEQLGALIRRMRLANGLSQEQLAERSGISARAVSDLERGLRARTRPETLRMLAEGLALGEEERRALLQAAQLELRESRSDSPVPITPGSRFPVPRAPLIGREGEVAALLSRLRGTDARLTTVTGPGGVGKTRLAIEAAQLAAPSFQDGAVFVDLSLINEPGLVVSALAQALGIRESVERSIQEAVSTAMSNRRLLLVLDNFEQVIDAAPMVTGLLETTSFLHILITSREILRVRGEYELALDPLEPPGKESVDDPDLLMHSPSIQLFTRAASAANPAFVLDWENAGAVAEICRRLDGLPLAIELAAARVRYFPPAVLLAHLDRRLPVLTGGARDLPARQQTLRDTIAWSYDLLSPEEQVLLRRLSVFAGGAALPAIEQVVPSIKGLPIDLLTGLVSLVEKSLLREQVGASGAPRFAMLETIREFAREKLIQAGEEEQLRHALMTWCLDFLNAGDSNERMSFVALKSVQVVGEEIENIHDAVAFAAGNSDAESCARFSVRLTGYHYLRGQFREARALAHQALALAEALPISDRLRSQLLGGLSIIEIMMGDAASGELLSHESLDLLRGTAPESPLIAEQLINHAIAVREQGRYAEAMDHAELAYRLAEAANDQPLAMFALFHVGKLALLMGDLDGARAALADALSGSDADDPTETALYAADYLAATFTQQGRLVEAATALRTAERLWRDAASEISSFIFPFAAALAAEAGDAVEAVMIFGFCRAHDSAIGVLIEDEPWITEVKRALRSEMGDEAYEEAFRSGGALHLDEVMGMMHDLLEEIEAQAADRPETPPY